MVQQSTALSRLSMDNHTAFQVELAQYLATSSIMHAIVTFRLIIGVLGLFGLSILLRYRSKFIAHTSLVILLSQHCFWSFIQSMAHVIENSILAYQFATYTDPVSFLSHNTGMMCILRTGWILFAFYGGVATMFVITIERAVASRHFRSYERSSSRLGYVLTIVEIGMVVSLSYLVIYFYDFGLEYARCTIVREKGMTFHMIQGTGLIIVQFYSTITFCQLLRKNRRKIRAGYYSLTERYQLSENVKTLELLVPLVCSHISLNLIAVCLFMLVQAQNLGPIQSSLAEESLGFNHLHSVIVPAVIYTRHRSNSESQKRIMRTNNADAGLRERHLEIVERTW